VVIITHRSPDGQDGRSNPDGQQDLAPLEPPQRTPLEQAEFEGFCRGWDACADYLWPLLQRAEHDADIWYARATPGEMFRRMDAHFRNEDTRFFGGSP